MAATSKTGGIRGSPTASRRRIGRGRILTSPGAVQVARSPLLIEISSRVLSAGYVGQARARRLLQIPAVKQPRDAAGYYRIYSPLVQESLELLGDVKDRRVLVAFTGGIFYPRVWKEALERIFLQDIGVPACCFQPSIKLVPMAFPPQPSWLVVQVTPSEAHCMASAMGHALDFTYQVCTLEDSSASTESALDRYKQQLAWVDDKSDSANSSLVKALLLCLEACPREARRAVAHNIVFVGSIIDTKGFGVQVARSLRKVLKAKPTTLTAQDKAADPVPSGDQGSPEEEAAVWTNCPVQLGDLRSFADEISVVCLDQVRPDVVPWLGTSLWASHWHGLDPDSENFRWIKNTGQS